MTGASTHGVWGNAQRLAGVAGLAGALFVAACDQPEPSDSGPDTDTDPVLMPNHRFELYNYSGNINASCARQLLVLKLTPAFDGDAIEETFVLNPGDELELDLTLAEEGSFRIEVLERMDGPSIWWDSVALGIHGTTSCFVTGINTGFLENSRCSGLAPSGSTMVCEGR